MSIAYQHVTYNATPGAKTKEKKKVKRKKKRKK